MSPFLELHEVSGERILVNPAHIHVVYPTFNQQGSTVITAEGRGQWVLETLDEIQTLLRAIPE